MARTNQEAVTAFGEILRFANVPGSYNSQNNRMAANDNRIFIACGATDFRKQIPGLAEELLMLRTLAAKHFFNNNFTSLFIECNAVKSNLSNDLYYIQ